MVAIHNRCTYPRFLLALLPLLWVGICIFTWVLLTLPPRTDAVAESLGTMFSMMALVLSVAILFVLLDAWFGRTVYEERGEWLHTEKDLFGFRRAAFDYDPDLLEECHISHVDMDTPVNREDLERLRHAGATICRKGKMGTEYPAPCWVCRIMYDGQPLILLTASSRQPVERLAGFMEAVIRQRRERRP